MRNPLYKRIKREFISDIGKYMVIIVFFIAICGLISGYIVGNDSMIKTFYKTQEDFNVEDGHFELNNELSSSSFSNIEKSFDVKMYNLAFKEESHDNHVIRTYAIEDRQDKVNQFEVMEGRLPQNGSEIALDRAYCNSNKINVGDSYVTNSGTFVVTGFIALADYSALFQDNADATMNTTAFCVALVTKDTFENVLTSKVHYNYAYKFNSELDDNQKEKQAEKMMTYLYIYTNKGIVSFLPASDNQAITFAIDDVEHDLTFLEMFFYIIVAGLAFVFALTTKTKIEQEAKTIGTLKAMGYTRINLLGHYLILPMAVTLVGAAIGNIFGYTVFKDFSTSLYYRSYSFPTYTTYFSVKAFLLTTLVPIAVVLFINFAILFGKLGISTKAFLQGKVKKRRKPTAFELPKKMSLMNKIHFRVITTNKSTYASMLVGLLFANLLLIFGLCLNPMLDMFKEEIMQSQVAPYEYVLKSKYDVEEENVEAIKITMLEYGIDTIQVIGVDKWGDESQYLKDINLVKGECVISKDLQEKYKLKKDSTFEAKAPYSGEVYTLKVSSLNDQAGAFYVYLDMDTFNDMFKNEQVLPGYLSEHELDIPDEKIYMVVTKETLQASSEQMSLSMGDVFVLFDAFAILLFAVIIYLLARIVVEKNAQSIAMMKILGFNNFEINRAYNLSTGIVVVLSELITIPLSYVLLKVLWVAVMKVRMKGWITFYIEPWIYFAMFGIAIAVFAVVFLIEYIKTKKIPLSLALKRE